MSQHKNSEFTKTLSFSLGAHALVAGIAYFSGLSMSPKIKLDETTQAMNVMWAETAMSPPKTVEHKLPGPAVVIPEATKPEEPTITKDAAPTLKATPEIQAKVEKKKSIADALASLGDLPKEEKRPKPNINNFPSTGETKKAGLPASPLGGGSSLISSPSLSGYKQAIQKMITGHFVWFKKEQPLYAEISFSINELGEVLNPDISQSSGDSAFDQAALRAVLKSSPLPKPPTDVAKEIVRETFGIVFDTKRMKS